MAKPNTSKTFFLTLSGSNISIVDTGTEPKNEGDYDVNE